jgi:hypothetical protein
MMKSTPTGDSSAEYESLIEFVLSARGNRSSLSARRGIVYKTFSTEKGSAHRARLVPEKCFSALN